MLDICGCARATGYNAAEGVRKTIVASFSQLERGDRDSNILNPEGAAAQLAAPPAAFLLQIRQLLFLSEFPSQPPFDAEAPHLCASGRERLEDEDEAALVALGNAARCVRSGVAWINGSMVPKQVAIA